MSGHKAFFLFNLKPQYTKDQYIEWTLAVNHPGAAKLRTIKEFHDYVSVRSMRGKPIAYQFVEEIEVTDFDEYDRELNDPNRPQGQGMKWADWVDPDYVVLMTDRIK